MQQGIRQGDPASGYIFNIAVEMLSEQITKSEILTGIRLANGRELRISQYADDTILLLEGTDPCKFVNGAVQELVKFASIPGLKINLETNFVYAHRYSTKSSQRRAKC